MTSPVFRAYDPNRDSKACQRIWQETGWIERDNKDHGKQLAAFLKNAHALIAELDGEAECLVASCPGDFRYQKHDLALGIVAAVTTSLVGRRQGLASRLTARLVAEQAAQGAPLSALGMFEQGFYTRLGFGSGPYEHVVRFDPSQLNLPIKPRPPVRLTASDHGQVYDAMTTRWRAHGGVNMNSEAAIKAEMGWTEDPFGLGYRDSGRLTHFIWGSLKGENGPLKVSAMAYQNRSQLLELLALLGSLSDQVHLVEMIEPAHLQMQDIILTPFRRQNTTEGTEFEESISAEAWWQMRINDLQTCIGATRIPTGELAFNLDLADPIGQYLPAESSWQGTGGKYHLTLGESSSIEEGFHRGAATLSCSISGLTRLWLGCASAYALASCGDIEAPDTLLELLQDKLCLPTPRTGWEF